MESASSLSANLPGTPPIDQFFEHTVLNYNCGDIRKLLEARLPVAGPLLASVVNGIDLVGGMMIGFSGSNRKGNSALRSAAFMETHLALAPKTAKMVYEFYRCGISHEGSPTYRTIFLVNYSQIRSEILFYIEDLVYLDVTAFAHRYLAAIQQIAKDPGRHLKHVPTTPRRAADVFADAVKEIGAGEAEFVRSFPEGAWESGSGRQEFITAMKRRLEPFTGIMDPYGR